MNVMCWIETQVEDTLVLIVFDCSRIDIHDMISVLELGHKLKIVFHLRWLTENFNRRPFTLNMLSISGVSVSCR